MTEYDDEAEEILDRIEELEILQQALQQMSEALELFRRPIERSDVARLRRQ